MTDVVPTVALNDGHLIPQLGYGVWQVSNDDIVSAVSTALETGYRHIDTAAAYDNEEGVGRAIAGSGIARDDLFVTTKLWNTDHHRVLDAAQTSLDKLGLDHVDLYLIHWPSPKGDFLKAWQDLQEVRARGLARSIGVSNFTTEHLTAIAEVIDTVPAVNQIELHPTFAQRELSAFNASRGIVTQAWSPLGQAADLTDPAVLGIAERLNRTPAQVVLRWHLQKGYVVFPKSVTPSRIVENFTLFDFELDTADMAAIDGLDAGNRVGPDPDTADF